MKKGEYNPDVESIVKKIVSNSKFFFQLGSIGKNLIFINMITIQLGCTGGES